MKLTLGLPLVAVFVGAACVACSASSSAPASAGVDAGAVDGSGADSASAAVASACAPLADAGDVCTGMDARVVLFPAPTGALAAGCRAYLASESSLAAVALDGPAITAPANGDVLSLDTWAVFQWSAGAGETGNDEYVVLFRQGCDEIVRVVEQGTGWTVDAPSWARMKAVSGPMTMTVVWIGADGSQPPRASAPVTFTLGP